MNKINKETNFIKKYRILEIQYICNLEMKKTQFLRFLVI